VVLIMGAISPKFNPLITNNPAMIMINRMNILNGLDFFFDVLNILRLPL